MYTHTHTHTHTHMYVLIFLSLNEVHVNYTYKMHICTYSMHRALELWKKNYLSFINENLCQPCCFIKNVLSCHCFLIQLHFWTSLSAQFLKYAYYYRSTPNFCTRFHEKNSVQCSRIPISCYSGQVKFGSGKVRYLVTLSHGKLKT